MHQLFIAFAIPKQFKAYLASFILFDYLFDQTFLMSDIAIIPPPPDEWFVSEEKLIGQKQNNALFADGRKRIDDYALAALTIMIAESKPEEKEMMVKVVMNCLEDRER